MLLYRAYLLLSLFIFYVQSYQRFNILSPFVRDKVKLYDRLPLAGVIERIQRPKPVGLPRKRMDLSLAVLLMRSSYGIVDDLDFIPMDMFQKDFFIFRQDEWEDYKGKHPTVMQGDLADPLYFDFISFAQYATISSSMRNGQLQFVEKVLLLRACVNMLLFSYMLVCTI